jgi:hypothetical protein
MANHKKVRTLTGRAYEIECRKNGFVLINQVNLPGMSEDKAFARANRLVKTYDRKHHLVARLTPSTGRKRKVPWLGFLILVQFYFILHPRKGKIEDIRESASLITRHYRELGIDGELLHHYFESYMEDLRRAFEPEGSVHRYDRRGVKRQGWRESLTDIDLDQFSTSYLTNSIPDGFKSTTFALDATHYETWAKSFVFRAKKKPGGEGRPKAVPLKGHDGRDQWSWAALVGEPEHVYPDRLQKLKRLRGLAAHFDSDSDPGGGR